MKAKIEIIFEKINGIDVNGNLMKQLPQLYDTTLKTSQILCEQIQKYFADNKIRVKTKLELIK